MKKKILAIEAVALILGTILVSSISAQNIEMNTHETIVGGLGQIEVDVEEKYGSKDNPQIRPLEDVDVVATNVFDRSLSYSSSTDINGECTLVAIVPGLYHVKVSKEDYVDISSGCKKYQKVWVNPAQVHDIDFTMAEKGSPWAKQDSCNAISQFVTPLFHQILTRLLKLL